MPEPCPIGLWTPRAVSSFLKAATQTGLTPCNVTVASSALHVSTIQDGDNDARIIGPDGRHYLKVVAPGGLGWWFNEAGGHCPDPFGPPAEPPYIAAHRCADQQAHFDPSKCYFIGGDFGRVKIGKAAHVASRLRELQTGCPYPLKVLALSRGGYWRESAYHEQFADYRAHGEWFDRVPAVEAEMERLNTRPRPQERGAMVDMCRDFEQARRSCIWSGSGPVAA